MEWVEGSDIKLTLVCLYEYLRLVEEGKTHWEEGFTEGYLKPLIARIEAIKEKKGEEVKP